MKFTYALGNEFFFGHKLCLAADFAVVLSSVIGRGSDLHRVVFFILHKPNSSGWGYHPSKTDFNM